MKEKIFVVIPSWNAADIISACLASLNNQTCPHKVIVVENGSTDDSINVIKQNFPEVIILEFSDNAGFAGGVNRGIKYALDKSADYIALFNNDAVADKNWLMELVREINTDKNIAIVTGKLMRSDKTHFDSTGDFYTIWGLPYPRSRNQLDTGQHDQPEEVFGASGGASLYRPELFKQIGLFDEDFFAYYEDVDISFRAQMAGWKVRYAPNAVAYHSVGGTSSKMGDFARFHSAKNFLLLYARNMPSPLYLKYLPLFTLQFGRMALSSIVRHKFRVFASGSFAAIKLQRKTLVTRRNNLSKQKVSNDHIDSILTHSRPPKIPSL